MERANLARGARLREGRVAVLAAAVTWLPLLVLAAVEGVAWSSRVNVPFLGDFLPYGQFLVAIPLLVLGESFVGRRLGLAAAELRRSNVVAPDDTPALVELYRSAISRWRSRSLDILLAAVTCLITGLWLMDTPRWLSGEWQAVGSRLTLSGWWYVLISMPVLRFLFLRWLWRLLLWGWVLWRTAQLKLRPQPTHPDRAGGLAFLGTAQVGFGLLVLTVGVQLSCLIADAVCYRGASLMGFRGHVIAFALTAVAVILLPLTVFVPKLARARRDALVFMSDCAYRGGEDLERQLRAGEGPALPGREVSSLSGFGGLYETVRQMRPVPMEMRHAFVLLAVAFLPFLPLWLLVIPAQEMLRKMGLLLF